MTPEKQKQLQSHLEAIAQILYEDANTDNLNDLEQIEKTIREQTLEHITPQIGVFCPKSYPYHCGKNENHQHNHWEATH